MSSLEDMHEYIRDQLTGRVDDAPLVVMTCGLAGAGKTTFAKAVLSRLPQFSRLSIDEIVAANHGIYGVDYPADEVIYEMYQQQADQIFQSDLRRLLSESKDVILDRSFYAQEDRDHFRNIIKEGGGRPILVYMRAGNPEQVWQRICQRSREVKTANNALDITRAIFDMYWAGFEAPVGEDEIVVDIK